MDKEKTLEETKLEGVTGGLEFRKPVYNVAFCPLCNGDVYIDFDADIGVCQQCGHVFTYKNSELIP